jgi:hypothetical protein
MVMDSYALEKLTNWTPELSPPPDSPLFRWRVLALIDSACVKSSRFAFDRGRRFQNNLPACAQT